MSHSTFQSETILEKCLSSLGSNVFIDLLTLLIMKKLVKVSLFLVIAFVAIFLAFADISPPLITTRASEGSVSIQIEGTGLPIYILSPENTTYNFNVGSPTIIDLNVSSSSTIQSWWYR